MCIQKGGKNSWNFELDKPICNINGTEFFYDNLDKSSSTSSLKTTYSLTINTVPGDAKIMILNIKPKYQKGIKLEKGSYHIKILKDGYETIEKWITLDKDDSLTINLQKKYEPIIQSSYIAPASNTQNTYSNRNNKNFDSARSDQECYDKGMYPSKRYSDGSILCSKESSSSVNSSSPTYSSNYSNSNNKNFDSARSDQGCYEKGMYPSKRYSDGSVLCSK